MPQSKVSRFIQRLVVFGTIWGGVVLVAATIFERSPENLTLLCSIACCGLYTMILYLTRGYWLPRLSTRPSRNAVLLGIFNAAIVETVFLVFEHAFGAAGVAAHPNLILDLLLTMPWYAAMVYTFVQTAKRRRFPTATVLLLGAIYELGADGVVGPVAGLIFGDTQLLDPTYWLLLGLFAFWQFIPVYSSMLLPPTWLIDSLPPSPAPGGAVWRDALRPLLWLMPFTGYVLVFVLLLGSLSPS